MHNRDLDLILAALFELRITCVENERTWSAIGRLAEALGGDRSAMFFGAPAPDRGSGDRKPRVDWGRLGCVTLDEFRRLSARTELTDDERDLVLDGLFELTLTYVEDDDKRHEIEALVRKFGGDADAMCYGATGRDEPAEP